MAMFAPIPLPGNDNSVFKDVMDYWQQLKQAKTQREQFAQNKDMQREQFEKNFSLQKQAQDRANQLLPFIVQQYKDTHNRSASENEIKQLYRGLIQESLAGGDQAQADPSQQNQAMGVASLPGNQSPEQIQMMQQQQQGGAPQIPQGAGMEQRIPTQPAVGQEQEIRAGNPRLSKLDKVAGLVPGIPKPEVHYAPNGNVITRYPSGRVTVQNMGNLGGQQKETPEERKNREIETASGKERSKINARKEEELLSAGDIVGKYSGNLETIHNLLEKNPFTTGNLAGLRNLLHLSGEDQGEFNAATLPLVGKLAKEISARGGAVAAGLATTGKPSLWQSHKYNKGITNKLIEESINTYNNAKEQYEDLTGKDYPKKMPKFLQEYQRKMLGSNAPSGTVLMYKNGKKYHIPENKAKAAEEAGYTHG